MVGLAQPDPTKMTAQHNRENESDNVPSSGRRITIPAARRMLGMPGRNYTDEDMAEILEVLYGIAEEGFEIYRDIGTKGERDDDNPDGLDER